MAATNAVIDLAGEAIPDEAMAIRYRAEEAISQPYEVDVELSVPVSLDFVADDCLRSSVALAITDDTGERRFFHGIVDRAEYDFFTGTHHHFRLRLRPTLASLTHRENSKIWQDMDVVSVVKEVFAEAGIDNVEWKLSHSHEGREIIVQYRETEFNFVERLFEDEGLFYFFRHKPDGHTLVVADDHASFQPSDDAPEVHFALSQGFSGTPITDFERTRSLRTTDVQVKDYNFEKPQAPPQADQSAPDKTSMPYFEYPGGFIKADVGKLRANAILRARRRDHDLSHGSSRAIGMRCGVPFTVVGAGQPWLDREYVCTHLTTWGEQTLESGGENEVCQNRFRAIESGLPYMAPRVSRRPRIRGIQTAVVTGPSSENQAIHVDKYGRIKVRFYWDRISQQDDTSSCWLRVSQLAQGNTMLLPRVGWEMAVAFMDGDPDRPFAMGRIYNGEKVAPAALPGAKASGGLKSYSTPGGAGINEVHLGDDGGSMGWTLNAQKDLNIIIKHDKTETIGVDSTHAIKVSSETTIGANETISVGADQTEAVGSVRSTNVGGSQTIDVGGNQTNNATHNMLETVAGSRDYSVGGNMTVISNTVMQTVTG
ncbi:MAG: type VI secretion system tip protein VgrG, partial [Deltaproteobacteria bacterium]|nr:type VI secretion system tip protein VgrG [Deltaproteobacteria bacterium]